MTKTPLHFSLLAAFIGLLLLSSCANPSKLVGNGDYDRAIVISAKRLAKQKKKSPELVSALEDGLSKANRRDLDQIAFLKKEGQPESWVAINDIYQGIRRRQTILAPLLPLVDKYGRKANIVLMDVAEEQIESKKKAAEFLYVSAEQLLTRAQNGDRQAAREAYAKLQEVSGMFNQYRDLALLMDKARRLGTAFVFFKMYNNAQVVLPQNFEAEILRMSVAELNSQWTNYHLRKEEQLNYDYEIRFNITQIDVSPEQVRERQYTDTKQIEDGFEYVYDVRGNVMKDSLGNDIKKPKLVTVSAVVTEVAQNKTARVAGRLEYFYRGSLSKTVPITSDAVFENFAATYVGDKRALSQESINKMGRRPLPFPTTPDLLIQAAEQLKGIIKQAMLDNRGIIQ